MPVLAELRAGPFTLRGMSLGGVYTSIHVPELDCGFDGGIALRSAAAVGTLFLSHGHADHVGALTTFLGIRALHGSKRPLRVIMPAEIVDDLQTALVAMTALQRWPLAIAAIGLRPGDAYPLRAVLSGFLPDVLTTFAGPWDSVSLLTARNLFVYAHHGAGDCASSGRVMAEGSFPLEIRPAASANRGGRRSGRERR